MEFFAAGPLAQMQLASGVQTVYTVTSGKVGRVSSIIIANPTGDDDTVIVWVGGHADANCIIPTRTVSAGDSWHFRTPLELAAGTTIEASTTTGSKLTITVNGIEVTP